MTAAHSTPRELAFYVATAFDSTGGPADWSSNGTYCYATEIDVTGLVRASVENTNNRTTLRGKHQNILALKNSDMKVAFYMHSSPAHAAEAAAAATYHLSTFVKSALGGEDLGYSIGADSSGAEDTDEIEIDSDPGYVAGDALFCYDTSGTRGEFYISEAIAAGPPVTLTLDRDLHFAVDAGGADRIYAVIDCWIDDEVTTDHAAAGHTTLWLRAQGDSPADVWTAKGCKPQLGQIQITAGEPITMPFDLLVTTFDLEASAEDFSAATIYGSAGVVPGISDRTIVKIAAVGDPLADVDTYGTISIDPGVKYERKTGPNGWEGNHGHIDTGDETTLEMMVDFATAWGTAFEAQTTYHVLIQVGIGTDAIGFYFPRVEFASAPTRDEAGNLTVHKLNFRALKGAKSVAGLSAINGRKRNAPMHIFLVA